MAFVVSTHGSLGKQAQALLSTCAKRLGDHMPYALHDEASWAAWSFAPFVRQAVTLRARAGLAAAVRDSLVDEGFAARARAADGGDVELQRAARNAQAVPAGEGFNDDDGGGGGGGGGGAAGAGGVGGVGGAVDGLVAALEADAGGADGEGAGGGDGGGDGDGGDEGEGVGLHLV